MEAEQEWGILPIVQCTNTDCSTHSPDGDMSDSASANLLQPLVTIVATIVNTTLVGGVV